MIKLLATILIGAFIFGGSLGFITGDTIEKSGGMLGADISPAKGFWSKAGNNLYCSFSNCELGSTSNRIAKGWFTSLDTATLIISSVITGDLLPSANNAYDIGSSTKGWQNIYVNDGTAAVPALSFASDTNTGIYRVAADDIGIVQNGSLAMELASNNYSYRSFLPNANNARDIGVYGYAWKDIYASGTAYISGNIFASSGSLTAPGFAFLSSSNSGFRLDGSGDINIVRAGSVAMNGVSGGIETGSAGLGTVAGYSLVLRNKTVDGATAIGTKIGNINTLTTAGAKIVSFYSDNITTEKAAIDKDGSITMGAVLNMSSGAFTLSGQGMTTYRASVADGATAVAHKETNFYALTTAGAKIMSFYSDNATTERAYIDYLGSFNAGAGTVLLPAYSFAGDPNSGIYNSGADAVATSIGGTQRFLVNVGGIQITGGIISDSNNTRDIGTTTNGWANVYGSTLKGTAADGASAVAVTIGSVATYTTTAKLASFVNNATEKAYIDNTGKAGVAGMIFLSEGNYLQGSTGSGGFIPYSYYQTTDDTSIITGANNILLINESADGAFDFAHVAQADPTIFLHSHNQSTTQWLSLAHNGTDAVIKSGTSSTNFLSGSTTSTIEIGAASQPGCLAIQDTDGTGFTYCTTLNGTIACSVNSCK